VPETRPTHDLTIIGAGPGGYVCALRAAQLGLRAALIEQDPLPGGTCLHRGCIPTKALLRTAEVMETAKHANRYGVMVGETKLDLVKTHKFKNRIVTTNAKGIDILSGVGRLAGQGKVEVVPAQGEPQILDTSSVVLATGSEVMDLPGIDVDGERIINSDHALELKTVPASLIVLGAGAVGVEFASIFAGFGSKVTIIELLPNLIPLEDADLGNELAQAFKRRRIDAHVGTRVEKVTRAGDTVRIIATCDGRELEFEADMLLVAVGRRPRTAGLGLEGTGVRLDRGYIEVDSMMRTGEQDVYAIGDIVRTPALAHVASHEGIVAAEMIAGNSPHAIDYEKVPSCTYCSPEVASIGLSESRAVDKGHDVAVGQFPFTAVGKAKIINDTRGFVKIVADRETDRVLGVHIIGPHATELIAEAIAALNLDATAEALFNAMHAHPTLAESMAEAAMAVHGRAIHL